MSEGNVLHSTGTGPVNLQAGAILPVVAGHFIVGPSLRRRSAVDSRCNDDDNVSLLLVDNRRLTRIALCTEQSTSGLKYVCSGRNKLFF